jgi:hypothetical protein
VSDVNIHDIMNETRYKKQGYQQIFGVPGTAGHDAMMDLCRYCDVFDQTARSHDDVLISLGLRRAFYHIWQYLKLETDELAVFYRDSIIRRNQEIRRQNMMNQGDG